MTITVRFLNRLFIASVIPSSLLESNADVGSSSMIIEGSFKNILAIASLCFCHQESLTPRSPISVSNPSLKSRKKSH
jgi:hypothetical protein